MNRPMFRKFILAISATAALGAAALAPTAASAWGHGHHRHHGWYGGYGFYGPSYIAASPTCYRAKRVVDTAYGPRVRRILVCN